MKFIDRSGHRAVEKFLNLYNSTLNHFTGGDNRTVTFHSLPPDENQFRDIIVRLRNDIYISPEEVGRLGLSDPELFAALAHEIGHILYSSRPFGDDAEQRADTFAFELGLGRQMISVIEKIIASRRYRHLVSRLVARIQYLDLLEREGEHSLGA